MIPSNSQARADVIERAINIEWLMHAVISQHFFGKVQEEFVFSVLYDEYCSFALKRRVLLKIAPDLAPIEQPLNRLSTIRNYFAHVGQILIDGPDAAGPTRIPDPRKPSRSVDFSALHQEFLGIEQQVTKALFESYRAKGGEVAA